MSQWVRLWDDMPNDPKWRVIARRASQSVTGRHSDVTICHVISVFNHMLINASNWGNWGILENWNDEVVAASLEIDSGQVLAIKDAMQGLILDGDRIKSWEKRQTKHADSSADRTAKWRRRKRDGGDDDVTRSDESVTLCDTEEKRREENRKKEKKPKPSVLSKKQKSENPNRKKIKTEIADGSQPDAADLAFVSEAGMDSRQAADEWAQFRDHHLKNRSLFADWRAAWRTWVRNVGKFQPAKRSNGNGGHAPNARASPPPPVPGETPEQGRARWLKFCEENP